MNESTPGEVSLAPRMQNSEKTRLKSLRCCICVLACLIIILLAGLVLAVYFAEKIAEIKGGIKVDEADSSDLVSETASVSSLQQTQSSADVKLKEKV